MKRGWGFDHIMTKKTKKRASADVGFIFIAYNLRRIMNIIGIKELIGILTHFGSKNKLIARINGLISRIKRYKQYQMYSLNFSIS